MSYKLEKINSDLVREISAIIFEEARDELLKSITITNADITNDLSYAKVYFTSLLDMDKKNLEKEVNEASSFIRRLVAERLNLRKTPELKFVYDESLNYREQIDNIIEKLHDKDSSEN